MAQVSYQTNQKQKFAKSFLLEKDAKEYCDFHNATYPDRGVYNYEALQMSPSEKIYTAYINWLSYTPAP